MKDKVINTCLIVAAAMILLFCAIGCKVQAPIARTDTLRSTITREVIKDTVIYITDSAGFRAALECDSLGRVHIRQIQDYYAGQFVKPSVIIKDNYIKVDCKIDSGAVSVRWKETHFEQVTSSSTVKVERVNYVTSWQAAQMWAGRLLFAVLIIFLGRWLLNRYTGVKL